MTMFRIAYLVLFVFTLVGCTTNEIVKNDWTDDNLKGKVKSYSETSYEAEERFGNIEKGKSVGVSYKKIFNVVGNEIERNEYKSDGSLDDKSTYKYDDKGNKIEYNRYNSDGSLDSKAVFKYDYDEKGNWVEKITFKNNKAQAVKVREFEYYD